jgi:thiol-disulfide isomerase/thioredoxin
MGDFALTDLEGRTVKLSHYRGSVVVVNFWATWCEPCKQELPFLDAYYRELASQGFVVLAIATDGPRTIPGVRQLVKQRGWTFPVLLDSDGAVMGDLNPRGAAPYTMYVDRLGRLAGDHDGYAPGDELGMRAKIQALLEEGKVPESEEKSEASVRVTNSLMVERRTVDAGTYGLLTDRLNLQGAAGNLTTFARADTMVFQDAPSARFQDDARLERLRVRYRLGDWNLIAGDFFEQLGRGIMLSVRKVDELGVDLEIRGGRLEYDGKALGAMLFVGRMNPANLDIVSEQFVEDTDDVLAGGRLSVRAIPGMELGVLGLHLRPTEQFLADPDALGITQKDQATAGGIFAEVPDIAGLFSLYVEGDFQRRIVAAEHSDGKAVYGTLGLHLPQLNVLAEGMYLDSYQVTGSRNTALGQAFSYNQVPTLERLDQIVDNVTDYTGGRLYLEPFFLNGDLVLHLNGMLRLNDPGEDGSIQQIHGFAGVKYLYQAGRSRVELSGGHRDEARVEGGAQFRTVTHLELDWLQALGSSAWALHLQSRNDLRSQENPESDTLNDFVWSTTLASIDWASRGSLAFEFGIDTQDPDAQQYFFAGILDLHLDGLMRALEWADLEPMALRATVGSQRGGIKCIAGICRDFPEFSGVRLSLASRHTLGG